MLSNTSLSEQVPGLGAPIRLQVRTQPVRILGEQILGLGLGYPIGFGDAAGDLSIFQAALTAADALWAADQATGSYGDEIAAYQAAATAAVNVLPNEIDSSQLALVQQAAAANGQLQNLNATSSTDPQTGMTTSASGTDAQSAHDLAYQMYNAYQQAISSSPAPVNLPPPPNPGTTSSGGSGGSSTVNVSTPSSTTPLLVAGGAVAAAVGGWWWWTKYGRRR